MERRWAISINGFASHDVVETVNSKFNLRVRRWWPSNNKIGAFLSMTRQDRDALALPACEFNAALTDLGIKAGIAFIIIQIFDGNPKPALV